MIPAPVRGRFGALTQLLALGLITGCSGDLPSTFGSGSCEGDFTAIGQIQGTDWRSPLQGERVSVQGVITAINDHGLYLESLESDDDPRTSEALFIHEPKLPAHLREGQQLTLNGRVEELGKRRDTQTALRDISDLARCGEPQARPVTTVTLPLDAREREALENMRVDFSGDLFVTDVYHLRRGDFTVAIGGMLPAPTEVARPGKAARRQERENRDAQQRVRLAPGDKTHFAMGSQWLPEVAVLGHDGYNARLLLEEPVRILPVAVPEIAAAAPDSLRIVAFNLENYFNGNGRGQGFPTPRGAETSAEFKQQRAQVKGLMGALQPGLLAVMELENDGNEKHSAASDLRADLNAGTGADWAIAAPRNAKLGSDQIAVGLFYRTDLLKTVGAPQSPDAAAFDLLNRLPVAQLFEHRASGERFLVVVNHFKSKGSCPDQGSNVDKGDGQGCWNRARLAAARALTDWLDGLRSEAEGRLLIVGDLNAYRMEDPVQHLVSAGYVDLTATASDDFHYSHVYFGAGGTLDHAFASPRLADQVRSASILNVNAGQPRDLRMEPSWLGSSDHDPVLVDVRFIQSSTSD